MAEERAVEWAVHRPELEPAQDPLVVRQAGGPTVIAPKADAGLPIVRLGGPVFARGDDRHDVVIEQCVHRLVGKVTAREGIGSSQAHVHDPDPPTQGIARFASSRSSMAR